MRGLGEAVLVLEGRWLSKREESPVRRSRRVVDSWTARLSRPAGLGRRGRAARAARSGRAMVRMVPVLRRVPTVNELAGTAPVARSAGDAAAVVSRHGARGDGPDSARLRPVFGCYSSIDAPLGRTATARCSSQSWSTAAEHGHADLSSRIDEGLPRGHGAGQPGHPGGNARPASPAS